MDFCLNNITRISWVTSQDKLFDNLLQHCYVEFIVGKQTFTYDIFN